MDREEETRTAEEKGRKKREIEIAKSLLEVLDIQTISEKTGLIIEEIKKIKWGFIIFFDIIKQF